MSIEAMKQALAALESGNRLCLAVVGETSAVFDPAITALCTAIEQAEKQKPSGWVNHANIASAVAERERGGSGDTHTWSESKTAYHTVPFYTTPPAAQPAVPLTEPELRAVLEKTNHMITNTMRGPFWPELEQACRAIEAAHGITGETK